MNNQSQLSSSAVKCPACGEESQIYVWDGGFRFLSCPNCISSTPDAFSVDVNTATDEQSLVVALPGYKAALRGVSDEQVADFAHWASLVRSYVRNRWYE